MRHASPVLVLALATVVLTWPLVMHLTDALPAYTRLDDDDLLVNLWSFWWTRASLLEGRGSFFYTHHLFHPEGATLTLTALSPAASVPMLPVMGSVPGLSGIFLAWNLNVLFTFWLSGVGAYLLAERVTRQPWAAVVAGLVFAFSPYRYDHLRHVNLSCTPWLPFVFLGLLLRLEGGGLRAALAFAVSGALVAASSTTYTAQLPLFGLVFCAAWIGTQEDRRAAARRVLTALPLPLALGTLLALPALLPALVDMVSLEFETPIQEDPMNFAFPLQGFFAPNRQPYVGLGVLGLAVYALARRAGTGTWAALAFLGLILAPGPVVKTIATTTAIPLPYALVRYFPGLTQNRFTERFLVFWFLGAAVLVAQALAGWRPFARAPWAWGLLVGALLMLELRHAPIALEAPPVPPLYESLAAAPAGWPVYEWPAGYKTNRRFMYHQIVHQRPICQGLLSRRPLLSYQLEEMDAHSNLREMILVLHHDQPVDPHQQQKLATLRRRYVFKPFARDGSREAFLLTLAR